MARQTVIPVAVDDGAGLDSFYGAQNQLLLGELRRLLCGKRARPVLYLWGESGCGKTHLLDACCIAARDTGRKNFYIALKQGHAQLGGLVVHRDTLICIDDLHQARGCARTQKQIFSLYENVMNAGGGIIVSGNAPLVAIGLALKDLESRLASGGIFNLGMLNDDEKRIALKLRAKQRGFSLEDNVVEFIMSHCRRDTRSLFGLLDKLDGASLQAQRKITIPFVSSLL